MKDNELIAEFMGGRRHVSSIMTGGVFYTFDQYPNQVFDLSDDHGLCYHKSWDWLMPVVEKISEYIYEDWEDNNYKNVTIHERAYFRTFGMIDSDGLWMARINRMGLHQENTLIKSIYSAVVQFIKFIQRTENG